MFFHGTTDVVAALAFVVSYFFLVDQNIYWASVIFMIVLAVQILIIRVFSDLKIPNLMWVAFVLGITATIVAIVFQMPIAIQWRPTAISWVIGGVCLIALLLGRDYVQKWILKYWMIILWGRLWKYQILAYVILFLLGGIVNLVVAFTFSEQIWVLYLAIAWIVWAQFGALLVRIMISIEHRRIGDAIILEGEDFDIEAEELPSSQ